MSIRVSLRFLAAAFCFSSVTCAVHADGNRGVDWPQFRGPGAAGVAEGFATPTDWDVPSGKNVAWKTPIPGLAHSSPIVVGERVFVTTAVSNADNQSLKTGLFGEGDSADDMTEHAWKLYCLDRATGRVLWEKTAARGVPKVKRHVKATHDNSTPAADDARVVALFGSEGLFCYSHDGELKWKVDLGVLDVGPHNAMDLQWGFAASPILVDGRVIVQCDVKSSQFIAAFDAADGREIWRTKREDVPNWCTPSVYRCAKAGAARGAANGANDRGGAASGAAQQSVAKVASGPRAGRGTPENDHFRPASDEETTPATDCQVICNGCKHIAGYDFATGKELWRMSGGGGIPVPTPLVAGELVFLTSNHRPIREGDPLKPVFVVRPDMAKGDITLPKDEKSSPAVAWMKAGRGCYMQTPLVYRDLLHICEDSGVLTCYDAATGAQKFRARLTKGGGGFTASGVAADGKLYYTSEDGDVYVLAAGAEFKLLATNKLGETCLSTPAISAGTLIFHTRGHVLAIRDAGK